MARRNGIAGQLPFGAPVARDAACGIGGGSTVPLNAAGIGGMLPLNAAPGIGGCRSVGIGARKTGVSDLAMATRRHSRGLTRGTPTSRSGSGINPACRWSPTGQKWICPPGETLTTGTSSAACPSYLKLCPDGKCIDKDLHCLPGGLSAGGARPAQPAVRGRRALTYRGAGIGKSYASRLLGKGVTVDVTRTGEGSYSATITTEGKSMANKVLGNKIQMNGGRHENGYHGSVGVGARKTGVSNLALSTRRHSRGTLGRVSAGSGLRTSDGDAYCIEEWCGPATWDPEWPACMAWCDGLFNAAPGAQPAPAHPKADMSPAYPRRPPGRHPKADMWPVPVPGRHPKADLSPVPARRPAPGVKRGRRGRALTLKAGR